MLCVARRARSWRVQLDSFVEGDQQMTMAQMLLSEFEQESVTTRRFLERVPADKLEWRPHPKSMSAGQLAQHIAVSPGQVVQMAKMDEVPAPDFGRPNPQPASV